MMAETYITQYEGLYPILLIAIVTAFLLGFLWMYLVRACAKVLADCIVFVVIGLLVSFSVHFAMMGVEYAHTD